MSERTIQKLDRAAAIVEAKFGAGAATQMPALVAAVLQSLALEEHSSELQQQLERTTDALCQAAAVAAGG